MLFCWNLTDNIFSAWKLTPRKRIYEATDEYMQHSSLKKLTIDEEISMQHSSPKKLIIDDVEMEEL